MSQSYSQVAFKHKKSQTYFRRKRHGGQNRNDQKVNIRRPFKLKQQTQRRPRQQRILRRAHLIRHLRPVLRPLTLAPEKHLRLSRLVLHRMNRYSLICLGLLEENKLLSWWLISGMMPVEVSGVCFESGREEPFEAFSIPANGPSFSSGLT